jgi:hypothetical protein
MTASVLHGDVVAVSNLPRLVGQDEPLSVMVQKLRHCRFAVGSGPKRFIRQLAFALDAGRDLDSTLTDKQKEWLKALRHQYRRQIGEPTKVGSIARCTPEKPVRPLQQQPGELPLTET